MTSQQSSEHTPGQDLTTDSGFLMRLIDALDYPFYVIDTTTYEVLLANDAAKGVRYRQRVKCHALTHANASPCDSELDPCPLVRVKQTGLPTVVEHIHFDAEGNARTVEVHAHPVKDEEGRITRMIEYSIDITERKRIEQEIIAAKDAAERAAKVKSEFLANMSHELRTPLNGVIGMATLLLDTDLDEAQRDFAETVTSSANALLGLIGGILDFSKIEAGGVELESEPFALRECVDDALEAINEAATAKNLELALDIAADVPATIVGDVARLRQVLLNLLSNAVKFTEEGEITVHIVERRADEDGHVLEFRVADTGIGIPPERTRHIFEQFTQVDESVTRKYGGTGLGLAISKRLCCLMGGDIELTSKVGYGSQFTFHIKAETHTGAAIQTAASPNLAGKKILLGDDDATNLKTSSKQLKAWGGGRADPDPGARKGTPPAEGGAAPKTASKARRLDRALGAQCPLRILVAEDNIVNQTLCKRMLERMGYDPVIAKDGEVAIELLMESGADVVLMDLHMPHKGGLEATRQIRRTLPADRQPLILALTASVLDTDRRACAAAGMNGFLDKPLNHAHLADALRQAWATLSEAKSA